MKKWKLSALVSAVVLVLDQLTKYLIREHMALFGKLGVLPFLDIVHYRNRGAAFGMLDSIGEGLRLPLFVAIFLTAITVIVIFLRKLPESNRLLILSLSLIMGGAVGNSIDRIRLGYVTDFIDLHWFGSPTLHWAAFNIADSAISIGVTIVLIDTLILSRGR